MRSLMLASLATVLCLFATGKATAGEINLVANGGFETGDFTGWNVSGPFNSVSDFFPHTGTYSAALGSTTGLPDGPGSLWQMINTQAGIQYELSFYLNCWDDNPESNFFEVYFDGVLLYSETDRPDDGPNWEHFVFTVIGDGSPQELRFNFGNDPHFFFIDDVAVCVPVPAGFIMAGMGALGLAGMHLRRRVLARKAQVA
ncbi:MAG: hypothetical protein JNJ77_01215 [Planctomycetia bacterium]|nr:hypothetical protein [Planctomycetia bacterium]